MQAQYRLPFILVTALFFRLCFAHNLKNRVCKRGMLIGLVIIAMEGRAIFPVLIGQISDLSDMQIADVIPACCVLIVLCFALKTDAKAAAVTGERVQLIHH